MWTEFILHWVWSIGGLLWIWKWTFRFQWNGDILTIQVACSTLRNDSAALSWLVN